MKKSVYLKELAEIFKYDALENVENTKFQGYYITKLLHEKLIRETSSFFQIISLRFNCCLPEFAILSNRMEKLIGMQMVISFLAENATSNSYLPTVESLAALKKV